MTLALFTRPDGSETTQKYCHCCETWQETAAFSRNSAQADGLRSQCRACCHRAYQAAKRKEQEARPHTEPQRIGRPPAAPSPERENEAGRYTQRGSVRLADDLPETTIATFFAKTHSKAFLLALCVELGIVEK